MKDITKPSTSNSQSSEKVTCGNGPPNSPAKSNLVVDSPQVSSIAKSPFNKGARKPPSK